MSNIVYLRLPGDHDLELLNLGARIGGCCADLAIQRGSITMKIDYEENRIELICEKELNAVSIRLRLADDLWVEGEDELIENDFYN